MQRGKHRCSARRENPKRKLCPMWAGIAPSLQPCVTRGMKITPVPLSARSSAQSRTLSLAAVLAGALALLQGARAYSEVGRRGESKLCATLEKGRGAKARTRRLIVAAATTQNFLSRRRRKSRPTKHGMLAKRERRPLGPQGVRSIAMRPRRPHPLLAPRDGGCHTS